MAHGSASKPSLDGSAPLLPPHYTKIRFAVAISCACALVYSLSFALMSFHRPCWSPCPPPSSSCSPFSALNLDHSFATKPQSQRMSDLTTTSRNSSTALPSSFRTDASRIVFGIAASADMWSKRKEYIKLWWTSSLRGYVWLDALPGGQEKWNAGFPEWKVSESTSKFQYTYKNGWRSAIRISRIASETFRLPRGGGGEVDWFVLGDDDTLFFPENLVEVLSKYDHSQMYYIGANSESHLQNIMFSYNMAFGGGGFALSYPLAKLLAKMQDSCLARYPHLFGSDDRMHACMAEIGIPLTKEPGFHQFDIHGDASGMLATHPVAPLVSIHHLDLIEPIFPPTVDSNYTRLGSLQHLLKATKLESASTMQQSICYDKTRRWSFTVSWGYVVHVYKGFITPRELEVPQKTFLSWHRETSKVEFPFNTRGYPDDVCKRPTRFFMESVRRVDKGMESFFVREPNPAQKVCAEKFIPLSAVQRIRVVKEMTDPSWYQMPRRACCRVRSWKNEDIDIHVGECRDGETLVSHY